MDLSGEDVAGEDLCPLLRGKGGEAIAEALPGCAFYEDDPEALHQITAYDPAHMILRLAGARSRPLAKGYVLLTGGLRGAIQAAITPEYIAETRLRRQITAFGFRVAVESDDLAPLAAAVAAATEYRMPFREARVQGLRLAAKYGQARDIAKMAGAWMSGTPDPAPGDLIIALVAALRDMGACEEALAHTEILTAKANGLTRDECRILLVQRGALWLDAFDTSHDPACLERAEQCAKRSWAIEPSDECSALYNRLRRAENAA